MCWPEQRNSCSACRWLLVLYIVLLYFLLLHLNFTHKSNIKRTRMCVYVVFLAVITMRHHVDNWLTALRMYRGVFLIILFIFLLGVNTYGWRSSGVNHVLIFELDPRHHLTHQEFMEVGLLNTLFEVICKSVKRLFLSTPCVLFGFSFYYVPFLCLQLFDAVGWAAGRASGL